MEKNIKNENNKLDIQKIINNKNEAITALNEYLDKCIIEDNSKKKKCNLLSYLLKDYIKYLEQEKTFNSAYLKEYKCGDIIKANLGFNVGNEEGGLHYCVVLDKKNAKSYSTLTVIPLSSVKSTTKIHKTSVLLENEIYSKLFDKASNLIKDTKAELSKLEQEASTIDFLPEDTEENSIIKSFKRRQIDEKMEETKHKTELIEKICNELNQMKTGTVALVNQITTISKQRIYDPKHDFDILAGIQLSSNSMEKIYEKIKKLYAN